MGFHLNALGFRRILWNSYGIPVGPNGIPAGPNGIPMEFLWNSYGIPMEFLWNSTGFLRNSYGIPMESHRNRKRPDGITSEFHRKFPTKESEFFATDVANLKSKLVVPASWRERGKIAIFSLGFVDF